MLFTTENHLASSTILQSNALTRASVSSFLALTLLALYSKILFIIFKDSTSDDPLTLIALLFTSIILTISLIYISSILRRRDFVLRLPTIILLMCKVFFIIYIIATWAIDLHTDLMILIPIWLDLIALYLGNEVLVFGMSGPSGGWVNYTGADYSGGNSNPPTPVTDVPYRVNDNGSWVIDDPENVSLKTKGIFIRGYNYGPSKFYRNAYALLSEKRTASEIPAALNAPQKNYLEMMRLYHFTYVEARGSFNPSIHKYNTESFRQWLKSYNGSTV